VALGLPSRKSLFKLVFLILGLKSGVNEAKSHQVFLQVPAERISTLSRKGDAAAVVESVSVRELSATGYTAGR